MIGTRLQHFEITSHIGSGGMGDVFQATDTKLGRSVAIKFLPEAFSHDSERVARFQREARVLASLNHSNIAAIYGVEEINSRHFLVMELVAGETLAERIKRGAIPIEEALTIAKQIAEALEEAHEKGVVHRDLKPANIKVTVEGKVKVLDFGLAKAYEREQANAAVSNSPTISMAATNAGMILGTAAYMSPEQARGRTVDRRTDMWALGCVLYEMLTGTQVFRGEDVTEILASVVKSEPDWNALPAKTPAPIRRLLRRCLEKDRKRRMESAADARLEIEEALAAPAAEAAAAITAPRAASSRFAWIIAGAAVLVAAGLGLVHFREASPPAPPEMRTDIVTPATSDPASFALSPDGTQIVYVADADGASRLWLRPLASATAQPLAGTEGASDPFWSPDSKSIGFFANAQLKRLDLGGGAPRTLAAATGRGGAWNAEDVILFAPTAVGSPLFRIPASGGKAVAVTKLDRGYPLRPSFLAGGRQFLFFVIGTSAPDTSGIYLGSLDSLETWQLTPANAPGTYLPSGYLLWVRAGALVAQRLDLEQKALTGPAVTLADMVTSLSVSATGLVAYRTGAASRRQLTWFDRSGKALGILGAPDENNLNDPRLSPDGRRVAVYRIVKGDYDIWLLDGTRTTRFTFDAANDATPIWSPDGSKIIFASVRRGQGHRDLYQKPSNGAGAEELVEGSAQDRFPSDWSPDGRFILYNSVDPQTDRDIWVMPMEGDRKPYVFLKTSFDERIGRFSRDGRWVAYMSNESGRMEIYIRPFAAPAASAAAANPIAGQWQVSTEGGINPQWSLSGKELYYIGPNGEMMAAPIVITGTTIEPGAPVVLFQTRIFGGDVDNQQGPQFDVARDGRFLINTVVDDSASSPITLLMNWSPEEKK
jgi:eukaryotic-like serine/threonine-protein kinase